MTKILFVCTGNICRSPAACAILQQQARQAGKTVLADSAGVSGWHSGEAPDRRAAAAAAAAGYSMTGMRARQVTGDDFNDFDFIYAMTGEHLRHLRQQAGGAGKAEIAMFPAAAGAPRDIPDPYYGGADGFAEMVRLLEAGCAVIVSALP